VQLHIRVLNRAYSFLSHCFHKDCPSVAFQENAQRTWAFSKKRTKQQVVEINSHHGLTLDPDDILTILPFSCRSRFFMLLQNIGLLRNTVKSKRMLLEKAHQTQMIKAYTDLRCQNFATNKAAFIASSLSSTKRSITLDRVMH